MVQFKLQHRGLVRKVTFKNVDQPSWHELSWKIGDVCNIPHAAVALTYLDPDGDKITISSQAELKEYYSSLDEDDLESSAPHKFIVRNLNDGIPDPDESDPREDNFLMRDAQTMAASTVGGGSQWGFNAEDEAERDPTKLRLSGYSTFADALSPLAGSATEHEDDRDKDELPGGFNTKPQVQESPPAAKSSGWGLPLPGFGWGKSSANNNQNTTRPASPPPAEPAPKSNPWAAPSSVDTTTKTPTWAGTSATTPTASKAPPTPWGAPSSVATGAAAGARPGLRGQGAPPSASTTNASTRNPSGGSTARPSTLVPPPVAPTVQMDSMVADRASSYAASPAITASFPKGGKKSKKKMTHREREAERQREEDARREEDERFEEEEQRAMEREAEREREENARFSAEAATRAVVEEQRRVEERQREWDHEREWERERERLKAEEDQRRRDFQRHGHQNSDASSEWQHVQEQNANNEEEDEKAYRERILASIANVHGTSPPSQQPQQPPQQQQPQPRQRKVSTRSKGEKSNGKSSRPTSKAYPPTPAPKKFFEPDLVSEGGRSGLNHPNSGYGPTTPGHSAPVTPGYGANGSKAQVCNDVADLLASFKQILDSEPDLLDAIREAFARGPGAGALNAAFGSRNLSPEMIRIVSSVDDLLTKILPNRPPASPYAGSNMELEPRIPTPSVTPTPVIPADPEFGVPPTEYGSSFEYANRGRQGVPVINVPRPKYPASNLTREGYSTGTTPPANSGYSYARPASPDRSAHARSRSRPPPGDFEIVPPSLVPPQARMVVPPPVVPGEETDESPMTPDVSRGFTRQSAHEGGLVLAGQTPSAAAAAKADMETARQHYRSQRELYKLEKAERKKEMEERAAAKAERKRAKAAASADPNIADLKNQLSDIGIPQRPYEAERRYIENPYENPRSAVPFSGSSRASTVYAEGLGQVTLMPMFPSAAAVTAPVSPVREDATTPGFERARRRRQSLNATSPERYPPASARSDSYNGPGAQHHAPPYAPAQPPPQDLATRVALKLTEMGYTPQKYPSLPAIVGHRIRPVMNTHGVNENELAYHIIQDLFKYSGQT